MSNYYVSGCVSDGESVSTCDDDVAQFWTLYHRNDDGLSEGIIDCMFREGAEAAMRVYEQRDALAEVAQRVIHTGELARPEHESLEAELCALVAQSEQDVSDARQDFEALIMLISRGLADVEKGINGYHDPQIQAFWENYQYSKGILAGEPS